MKVRIAHVLILLGVLTIALLYAWGAQIAKEREDARAGAYVAMT